MRGRRIACWDWSEFSTVATEAERHLLDTCNRAPLCLLPICAAEEPGPHCPPDHATAVASGSECKGSSGFSPRGLCNGVIGSEVGPPVPWTVRPRGRPGPILGPRSGRGGQRKTPIMPCDTEGQWRTCHVSDGGGRRGPASLSSILSVAGPSQLGEGNPDIFLTSFLPP